MRVVVAPDKFKGSLAAPDVAHAVAGGIRTLAAVEVDEVLVADGGDGTVDAAVAAGFERVPVRAVPPASRQRATRRGAVAVVELADACGLARLPGGRPAPLTASSRGAGEVIRAALDAGCTQLTLGVGGSASTDGGAGMLAALGARLCDANGAPLPDGGAALRDIASVDLDDLHPAIDRTRFVLACDVDNPLLGPTGAAAAYGEQKGAGPADVALLDAALARWAHLLPGADMRASGAGAAGGVGFAALAVLHAAARPGIELVMELTGLSERLRGAALVVTGEGSLDEQTLAGKAPAGVAAAARGAGVSVVAVAGRCTVNAARLRSAGIRAVYTLLGIEPDLHRCLTEPVPLLHQLGNAIARDWLGDSHAA